MSLRSTLSQFWFNIQQTLFPFLEENIGDLSDQHKEVVSVLELVRIENFLPDYRFRMGRPIKDRAYIARAYVAKSVLKFTYTDQLIKRLESDKQLKMICGWEAHSKIPDKSIFSRAFKEFAEIGLPERVHQMLIKEIHKDTIIGHIGHDSTPLIGRERPLKKEGTRKERKKAANKRYLREKKGIEQSRRKKQMKQTVEEMLADIPMHCDMGMKKNSQGIAMVWKGFKLHTSISDMGIAVAAVLTSASLNDCEAGIPLMAKTNKVVQNFYDLMDSAYDVPEIKEYSKSLGHVPIIDTHARGKTQKAEKEMEAKRRRFLGFNTAESKRYKARFPKERFNSLFKEYYGGKNIQYKGPVKVFCHAMFGILTCTAITLMRCLI
jgi:Transposase DDE domain/Transposase domain (DUF772)